MASASFAMRTRRAAAATPPPHVTSTGTTAAHAADEVDPPGGGMGATHLGGSAMDPGGSVGFELPTVAAPRATRARWCAGRLLRWCVRGSAAALCCPLLRVSLVFSAGLTLLCGAFLTAGAGLGGVANVAQWAGGRNFVVVLAAMACQAAAVVCAAALVAHGMYVHAKALLARRVGVGGTAVFVALQLPLVEKLAVVAAAAASLVTAPPRTRPAATAAAAHLAAATVSALLQLYAAHAVAETMHTASHASRHLPLRVWAVGLAQLVLAAVAALHTPDMLIFHHACFLVVLCYACWAAGAATSSAALSRATAAPCDDLDDADDDYHALLPAPSATV